MNDGDFSSARWQPFSSNLSVTLGSTDGFYSAWIGLRGSSTNSPQDWELAEFNLDTVPPVIVITGPTNRITSQPLIQLEGYTRDDLVGLHFDLINSSGVVSNTSGFVTGRSFASEEAEPVTWRVTSTFKCFDIDLAKGTNQIKLRATDIAGNTSTNTYTYVLDYSSDTNPPVLTLYWPEDGEKVCGSDFTLRGRLDDPTATVLAEISIGDGDTNTAHGLVERDGLLWVEHLPLKLGTNCLRLKMTDAAGNVATTNLTVIRDGELDLTIDPVPGSELLLEGAKVTGTINSTNYTVWVNGVKATRLGPNKLGTWTWMATNVPTGGGGTAVIQATAIPNWDNGGNGTRKE